MPRMHPSNFESRFQWKKVLLPIDSQLYFGRMLPVKKNEMKEIVK